MPSTLRPSKFLRLDPAKLASNPRATLSMWRRYEGIVSAAMKLHPKVYHYNPGTMAASTVVSQIRDAIRGKIVFDYPSDSVSTEAVTTWWAETIVRCVNGTVLIGPPEQQVIETLEAPAPTNGARFVFDTLSLEELNAFCVLLSSCRLEGPIIIQDPPDLTLLPQRINIEIVGPRDDGSIVLL